MKPASTSGIRPARPRPAGGQAPGLDSEGGPTPPRPSGAPPPEGTDRSLLRRFKAGSDEAATQLYLRYARRLYQLARSQCPADLAQRVDAEDIVQSVFS